MQYLTASQIKAKVQRKTDTEFVSSDDEFVSDDEFIDYLNDAINECEANIHKIGAEQEYFQKRAYISIVQGQQEYSLPSDIYANKIKKIFLFDNSTVYEVDRLRGKDRYYAAEDLELNASSSRVTYKYLLQNASAADGVELLLFPTPVESLVNGLRVWYVRNANLVSSLTDIVDIPEFYSFIVAYVVKQIWMKEDPGSPMAQAADMEYQQQAKLMMETLEDMIPDEENTVIPDTSFYNDSV